MPLFQYLMQHPLQLLVLDTTVVCHYFHPVHIKFTSLFLANKKYCFNVNDLHSYVLLLKHYLKKGLKNSGQNGTQSLTSAMLVQCSASSAFRPTGSWSLGGSMISLQIMDIRILRWLYILFHKGLNMTSAKIIFPLANVYPIALGIRSIIKTYSVRLHTEDSCRTQMLLLWQLLIEIGLFF